MCRAHWGDRQNAEVSPGFVEREPLYITWSRLLSMGMVVHSSDNKREGRTGTTLSNCRPRYFVSFSRVRIDDSVLTCDPIRREGGCGNAKDGRSR